MPDLVPVGGERPNPERPVSQEDYNSQKAQAQAPAQGGNFTLRTINSNPTPVRYASDSDATVKDIYVGGLAEDGSLVAILRRGGEVPSVFLSKGNLLHDPDTGAEAGYLLVRREPNRPRALQAHTSADLGRWAGYAANTDGYGRYQQSINA